MDALIRSKLIKRLAVLGCVLILFGCDMEADLNGLNDAAYEGDTLRITELLEQGADPNGKGWDGDTPLANAIRGEHVEVVKILLENGSETNNEFVQEAIYSSNNKAIKELLKTAD